MRDIFLERKTKGDTSNSVSANIKQQSKHQATKHSRQRLFPWTALWEISYAQKPDQRLCRGDEGQDTEGLSK